MKIMTLATIVAAAAVVSLTPGVANAEPIPSGCTSGNGYPSAGKYYYTWAKCTVGGGYVQAVATCTNGRVTTKARGPWVYVGSYSTAHCPDTHQRAIGHAYTIKKY